LNGFEAGFEESEVDPCFEKVAQTDEASVQNHVLSTVGGRRAFGLPDWYRSAQCADTESKNESTNNELGELEAGALECFSNEGQRRSNEDDFPASKYIADPGAQQGAKEGTNCESSHDRTLDC
jgi:hypothetical protein